MTIAWGAKVSDDFRAKVCWIEQDLGIDANSLMACMAWETGQRFTANVRNAAGSGAVGLIQFMPQTAAHLGTTIEALASMTPEAQLNYVWKYFSPYKGQLHNLGDVYGAILWPGMIGKADTYVLWTKSSAPITYLQNKGLDVNADGTITRGEVYSKVRAELATGWEYDA
jgi:hypothetical protein